MATDIVKGLFGMTPERYQLDQQAAAREQAMQFAQMDPFQRANYGIFLGGRQLGDAIGGALGAQDPMLQRISQQQALLKEINFSDEASILQGAKKMSAFDPATAAQLSNFAIDLYSKQAQAQKNLQPPKLTGDERYINILQAAESRARAGKDVPAELLSNANIAAQMLSKPRSYFDPTSGQTISVPATDPSKAFPNIFKLFGGETSQQPDALAPSTPTPGAPSTTQVTQGNLPAGSQKRLGEINSSLVKLEQSGPELQDFLAQVKEGKVKYDASSNVFDFLGAVVPPAFGFGEVGNQADKDKIDRALKERVNSLLLMAKGTQTEGDAQRAADQIASYSTRFSPLRMQSAIDSLIKAEEKLKKELGAERTTLLGQGRPETATSQPSGQMPAKSAPKQQPQQPTNDQKIQRFIDFNGGKPSREEAERILRSQGIIK